VNAANRLRIDALSITVTQPLNGQVEVSTNVIPDFEAAWKAATEKATAKVTATLDDYRTDMTPAHASCLMY